MLRPWVDNSMLVNNKYEVSSKQGCTVCWLVVLLVYISYRWKACNDNWLHYISIGSVIQCVTLRTIQTIQVDNELVIALYLSL